jgi:hypothetical protein
LERLRASSFVSADYTAPSVEWDHHHCEGCWAKFAACDEPDILHHGYFTIFKIEDKASSEPEIVKRARKSGRKVFAKPDAKVWVCPDCFEKFHAALAWKLSC